MSKKKIPEVRLLLDGETLFDMDRDPDDQEVLVQAMLHQNELTLRAVQHGKVVGEEYGHYGKLGVVVLSKREHGALKRAAETLEDIRVQIADVLNDDEDDSDREDMLEGIHNAAARALGKEAR